MRCCDNWTKVWETNVRCCTSTCKIKWTCTKELNFKNQILGNQQKVKQTIIEFVEKSCFCALKQTLLPRKTNQTQSQRGKVDKINYVIKLGAH